jgi:hypothetical protein
VDSLRTAVRVRRSGIRECHLVHPLRNLLVFRSGTLGYYDLTRKAGTENYGGLRPGCWINALPVGGLVLVPDASSGCKCSYQNRAWVAHDILA